MCILKNFSVVLVALTFIILGCSDDSSGPGVFDSSGLATVGTVVVPVDPPPAGVEPAFILTEADSGQTFVVRSGTVFEVQLEACWSCGAGWGSRNAHPNADCQAQGVSGAWVDLGIAL